MGEIIDQLLQEEDEEDRHELEQEQEQDGLDADQEVNGESERPSPVRGPMADELVRFVSKLNNDLSTEAVAASRGQLWFSQDGRDPCVTQTPQDETAEKYCLSSIFVWNLHWVRKGEAVDFQLCCPICKGCNVERKGYTKGRRVIDNDQCFYIITMRYVLWAIGDLRNWCDLRSLGPKCMHACALCMLLFSKGTFDGYTHVD